MTVFADASALVKLYADEEGHDQVRSLDVLCVSQLSRVEVPSAIWRKQRTGQLSVLAAKLLCDEFEADYYGDEDSDSRFVVVSVTEEVLEEASVLIARYGLRAYDSVQLATALAVSHLDDADTTFLCFDKKLSEAAATEGLQTLS